MSYISSSQSQLSVRGGGGGNGSSSTAVLASGGSTAGDGGVGLPHSRSRVALDQLSLVLNTSDENDLQQHGSSLIDGLLTEIYDRWNCGPSPGAFDSDMFTEQSSPKDSISCETSADKAQFWSISKGELLLKGNAELKVIAQKMTHQAAQTSAKLIRHLKTRDRQKSRLQKRNDLVTAILHAASMKRSEDARMRFTLKPLPGDDCFEQWRDAMKAVARLPLGIPPDFRMKVWRSLADNHIRSLKLDWDATVRFCFNERSNPDDNKLGLQIVKDLHRTGCSGFSGQDNEEERALLKRVLLAYARWNKVVGYCQGFNVLAALILDVMDKREADALKVMIFMVDHVLPLGYFANNLRALTVDMAVFRELLRVHLPKLSDHLDHLQKSSKDNSAGVCYEPPLTNVFTMHWFLTLFATCLPKNTVLRVWDSVMLDGAEILLRTGIVIWEKLAEKILLVNCADTFYSSMGELTQEMMQTEIVESDELITKIYNLGPFPLPHLCELREKFTYNITPLSTLMNQAAVVSKDNVRNVRSKSSNSLNGGGVGGQIGGGGKSSGGRSYGGGGGTTGLFSSDEDMDEDLDLPPGTGCFSLLFGGGGAAQNSTNQFSGSMSNDISALGPGAYSTSPTAGSANKSTPAANAAAAAAINTHIALQRSQTDMTTLKKQYKKLRQRHRQAHVILAAASSQQQHQQQLNQRKILTSVSGAPGVRSGRNATLGGTRAARNSSSTTSSSAAVAATLSINHIAKYRFIVPEIESPAVINHLFLNKQGLGKKNRKVADGPRIVASVLTKPDPNMTGGSGGGGSGTRASSNHQQTVTNKARVNMAIPTVPLTRHQRMSLSRRASANENRQGAAAATSPTRRRRLISLVNSSSSADNPSSSGATGTISSTSKAPVTAIYGNLTHVNNDFETESIGSESGFSAQSTLSACTEDDSVSHCTNTSSSILSVSSLDNMSAAGRTGGLMGRYSVGSSGSSIGGGEGCSRSRTISQTSCGTELGPFDEEEEEGQTDQLNVNNHRDDDLPSSSDGGGSGDESELTEVDVTSSKSLTVNSRSVEPVIAQLYQSTSSTSLSDHHHRDLITSTNTTASSTASRLTAPIDLSVHHSSSTPKNSSEIDREGENSLISFDQTSFIPPTATIMPSQPHSLNAPSCGSKDFSEDGSENNIDEGSHNPVTCSSVSSIQGSRRCDFDAGAKSSSLSSSRLNSAADDSFTTTSTVVKSSNGWIRKSPEEMAVEIAKSGLLGDPGKLQSEMASEPEPGVSSRYEMSPIVLPKTVEGLNRPSNFRSSPLLNKQHREENNNVRPTASTSLGKSAHGAVEHSNIVHDPQRTNIDSSSPSAAASDDFNKSLEDLLLEDINKELGANLFMREDQRHKVVTPSDHSIDGASGLFEDICLSDDDLNTASFSTPPSFRSPAAASVSSTAASSSQFPSTSKTNNFFALFRRHIPSSI